MVIDVIYKLLVSFWTTSFIFIQRQASFSKENRNSKKNSKKYTSWGLGVRVYRATFKHRNSNINYQSINQGIILKRISNLSKIIASCK